jgi:hypothetical protein
MVLSRYFLLLLLLLTSSTYAQPNRLKGKGLISVEIEKMPTLRFFESLDSNEPIHSTQVFDDPAIGSYNIKNIEKISKDWFNPLHCLLDYYIFYFQCSDIKDPWYQIVINEKTDLKYWIKKADFIKYVAWDQFISDVVSVMPNDSIINPILLSPQINAPKAKKQFINCLTPVSVNGEWLKVRIEPAICDKTLEMSESDIFEGYIRWREGDELLITYYLLL